MNARPTAPAAVPAGGGAPGFTLMELLSVMAILLVILAMALGSAGDWGRAAAMRTSAQNVASALALARQWAVTHGQTTSFAWQNHLDRLPVAASYSLMVQGEHGLQPLGSAAQLGRGVTFATNEAAAGSLRFEADGSCPTAQPFRDLRLLEGSRPTNRSLTAVIRVFGPTGFARIVED